MDELNSSMEEAELSKTLKKLQTLESEKEDIVLGFIKEKEIIETIHQEQLEQLKVKHEDEIQAVRQEWLREREKLLRESDSRQVDAENLNEKKAKEIEKSLIKKSKGDVKETEEEYRKEKRKLREEYEAVIAKKTDEIEELYRENCILRSKSDPGSFEDKNKESDVMINKLQSKINALEEDKLAQIMKLKNEFEVEKAELERKQVREKAEFVKQLTSKYDQQNTNHETEKNKSYVAYKQEMEEKIEIVESLWEERNTEDRKKMNTRLENEIAMQKRRFADELKTKLLERDMTIENLEREKEELSKSVHVERFELAKFYNRELSILNRLDSPTKEDIEVALIDEVAKLRDEQQKVIRNLEKRHKRKMRDFKKSQKPLAEIEEQHKNELDEQRNNYEREKEEFEAKLRNEQLNLLKSFEFEKNDIERYFKQLMDEQESEFQDEIQEIQSKYEKVKDELNILEKENDELKNQFVQEKERNGELFDKLQECESQNARLKEEIERDKRNMREPIKEISAVDNNKEGLRQTVEKVSSLNIQLSDELEKERKRCENLLEKVRELEKEQEHLMTRSEADELQSSESGLELSSSATEKPDRNNRESYRSDGSSVEGKKSGEAKKEPSKEDLDMQMKLQDSVQEYLLEIKVLQNAMDEKEMEIKQLKDTFVKEKSDLNEQIQHLTDSLKCAVDEEDDGDEVGDLEELKSRYKKLTDSINQVIKDLANKPSGSETSHQSSTSEPSSEQNIKGFGNEVNALDELLSDELDTEVKEKLGKKLEEFKNNIKRSHELEKLEQQREHEQEKNRYLKELSDERHKELDVSGEVWNAVCEKLGLDKEESKDKLKEMLQEKDDTSEDLAAQKINSKTNGKSDDKENLDDKETKVGKSPDSEELKKLKAENASLQSTLKELETHYEKDKEELMEKLQTQHKEFVLSSEAEVIEKLIKEKSALEEASIVERFNLGSIYYMEMQDELEEILSQRKEDMNKEHEKEKLNIILKFNKDVADLHKLLADKDDNEVKLLQEKNSLAKKILDVQRRMPGDENNNNTDDIKAEAKKLESSLPLKKELADLQRQRQDEHEASVQNLEKALDLINDLLKDKNKGDNSLHRRYSFASASSQSDEVLPTDSPTGQGSRISVHESDLSDEEIRNKEDLEKALENLIDNCLSKEKENAESDTSSGASSDFESEPNSPPPENEEGVSDSGAESIESECVSIKKTDLEMAMNLERFSLGRIYYNEYKDSLKSALKKLAKVKDMNQDLEDKLTSGVKDLVNRTIFGKMIVQSLDIETQTLEVDDSVKKTLDKLSDNDDNDISLDTSPEVSEKEDVSVSSEDKDVDFENVKQDRVSNSDLKESDKEDASTQTDDNKQDNIKTAEQANEEKGMENKQNAQQDSMSDTAIKEISKEDATTQTDDLQDLPNNKEIKSQNQAADISSKASPREKEDKNDETVEKVREPATSHMFDQETPENETALKDGYDNEEPKPAAEEEEAKGLDSKDKDTKKADIEEEPQTAHGDERAIDQDKYNTENKENAEQEQNAALEDEKPEDAAKVKQLDTSDDQSQLSKDQKTTSDEDIPATNREELEEDDQPLEESDIETLKRENKKLKDKFNILKALVGKWFVEEIPELRTADKTKQEEEDARTEAIGDKEVKELREEEKCLAEEIDSVEKQILQLKDLNDANNKKEEEKLNAQELLALKQLEKADKALKKEEEKDLIELLKKEKEEVSKKLEELEMEIEEHEGQISNDEKSLFDLMSKKLELEERVALKARELDKNQKKLAQIRDDTEREKVEDAVNSLAEQKKVLEELQKSPSSTDAQEDRLPLNQQPSEVSDSDTRKDETEPSNLPFKDAHISPHVQELVKAKNNEVKKSRKLAKDIEKAKQDKDRYIRMTKDREDRMRPFLKKREKMQNNLGEIEEIPDKRCEDEVLSTIENGASNTPNEISDEKTVPNNKEEDIEREIMGIRDELAILGKKAKIPLKVAGEIDLLPSKLKELESEKDLIDQQIIEKQSTIENLESEEAKELFDILEAKAELNVKRLELQEAFPEGYEELPHEVQEAYELGCLEQEIKNALAQLDQEIKVEENNFKEAVISQRQGKLDDPKSAIAPMLEHKQNLALKLEEVSRSLPCRDDAGLVNAEAEQSKSEDEDASKRIREIEDMLRENEDSIKDEPLRAAAELGKLIESKQNKTDELLKAADAKKEKVKMAELKENALDDIPDAILSAIALGRETDEDTNQLSFEAVERENNIKERCLELQSLKSEGEDTKNKEDELLNVIEKQTSIEVQPVSDKEQNRAIDPLPASVFAENKAIKSELETVEGKMEAILNGQNDKENMRPELNDLSSFFQKKAEIEKNIKDYKEFDDLLNQERKLAEALKTAVNKKELEEIEQIIDRKEEEINKLKAKSNEIEEKLEQLNEAKTNDEQDDDKLILEIQEAIKETEQLLLEAQAEKEHYYENNNQEESNVQEAMSSLEDELEETREEMEFVENELEGLRSISENDNAVSPELLELTKLLHSQKSLKDYLLEIDTKLDDCDDTAKPSLSIEEIEALKDEKRDAERKIKEIQEEKSKFEVELQDDDIQETYASLCEEKSRLDQARNDVLHKIHGSDVFVQMAEELKEDKPSEEEQKYYTQALNQILSDQKTLIKLAEENEKLKEVACRQRELLENLSNSMSASLGEDLAQAIKLDSNLDQKENLQLPSTILDRINNKDETIAEILTDLENENKKLTTLNEDLSNELDHLREKIGETLSDAILRSNSQLLEEKMLAPIDEVISADKTVEEILDEQNDALGRLKDVIGENLTDTLLKPRTDVSGTDDHQDLLKASKIMNETDEDLQTVIAAYEFQLDNLGQRNDVLQTMLGNDLVHALLDIDQDQRNKHIPEYVNALAEKEKRPMQDYGACLEDSQSHPEQTSEAKERPYVEDDHADEESNLESEEASNLQLSTDSKPANKSKNVDGLTDKQESEPQDSEDRSLPKSKGSNKSEEMCSEIPKSSQQPLIESDVEKHGMTAPVRMVKDNKTLGEVIKDYENELDTLKSRLGPDLYKEILSAGILDTDDDGEDLVTEESEIESKESKKPSNDSAKNEEARKDSDNIKDIYPGEQKDLNEQTRKLHDTLEGKDQMLPTDIHNINDEDKNKGEEFKENVDEEGKSDGKATEEKPLSSKETGHKSRQQKSQKPALAAPKKMIEEKQSLADVINGYENDLETLKSRLGPELFQDILDAGKQYDAPGRSEAQSEEAQEDAYSDVALEERQDNINAACESKDERENLPSFETSKDELQRRKAAHQPDGLDQEQFAATGKGQADEFKEMGALPAKDDGSSEDREDLEDVIKEKTPTSVVKQKKGSEGKAKKPSLVAPARMIEENQTLAEVVEGYENDLDILKSRLGPELYGKILDAGILANAKLLHSEKEPDYFTENKQPGISGKAEVKPGDNIHESQDNKKSESLPYSGVFDSQEKASKDDASTPADSGDRGKGSSVSDVKNNLEDEGMNEEQKSELSMYANKPAPFTRVSEAQSDQSEIAAPKYMIDENKTLEEVIKGYESDLETLKSKLGPQLVNSLLATRNLGDENTKRESFDGIDQSNVLTEKQPSTLRIDDSKIESDPMEEPGQDSDHEENMKGNDQEKDLEDRLSEGETSLSDGELYAAFNIPNIKKEGTKSEPILDGKLTFSAPSIMAKEGKTLGEVIESYENDLEALKSKLGPKLFEHVLEIAKHDQQAMAGIAKDGYNVKTKEPSTIELTNPAQKKDAKDIVAEDKYENNPACQEKGKYDDEISAKEKDHPETKAINLESGESALTSIGNNGSELLSKGHDLIAPKQMSPQEKISKDGPSTPAESGDRVKGSTVSEVQNNLEDEGMNEEQKSELSMYANKPTPFTRVSEAQSDQSEISAPKYMIDENKTLEEVIKGYESDLETLKSKLGPQLVNSLLARQQKSQKPALAASKKMIEEKQSLADVIQGYEIDLETLKSRLGPELFQDILDAGKQYDAPGRSEAQPEEAQEDAYSERSGDGVALEERQDSVNAPCESKDERENLPSFETSKDELQRRKAAVQPDHGQDQTQFAATGKGPANEFEEMGAVPAKDNGTSEDREDLKDIRKEKAPTSVVKQKKGSEGKAKKPSLVAPTRMIEENQTLAEVVEGYESDLDILKSRLGPELFQDILDAGKQYDAPGRSEAQSEEAQEDAYSERSGDDVALEERQDSINAPCESKDERENLPSFETSKDELQRRKAAHQSDGLDQEQFAATGKGQADEFKEMGALPAKDNGTSEDREDLEDARKEKAPTSVVKQKKGSEGKAKKPSLVAPARMIEENQTLAEVVEGYENDLDILKSRLGPELYGKILGSGKLANVKLLRSEKEPDSFAENKQPAISGKAEVKPGDNIHESQDNKESESLPYSGVFDSQEKASKDDASTPAKSGDRVKGSSVSNVKNILEDEGMNEGSELSAHGNKPTPFTRVSEAQSDQSEIAAPKYMIDENKTLEEVIKGYESDLETLKSKLGPQLVNSLLATRNLGDENTKRESFDGIDQSNVLTEKQSSPLRFDDSKIERDTMEEPGQDSDHEENMKGNDQEKDLEYSLSEGETYLSDGELYESFNIPNIKKEGTKSEPILDGKLTFSAPSIMAKEGKTLGEVIESYENDLEALKSKLGPKLFEHVLEIAKHDQQAMAGIAKDGFDVKKDSRTKEPSTIELTNPAQKKDAEDIDGEDKYENNPACQEKGKYDDEISAKEKDHPETKAINLESGESALTSSIDNNGSELLSKEHDLVAPKQMFEENKTLEEIIESYENDLRDFRESLGPQLCNAILNARKGIGESSDEATLGKEDFDEHEMDYLEQTTDEKGKKAANWKAEIGKVILENQPQQALKDAEDNKKNIGETDETKRHSDTQNEQQLQNEDGKDASDSDKDAKDDKLAEQNITTQKLEAPKMIEQGKKLDEIICGYENELGALKSRIGPILYEDIVNAGKPAQTYGKAELRVRKKPEVSETIQAPDVTLKEKEDKNIEGGYKEHKGKKERPSTDIAIKKKSEEEIKNGTSAEESDKNVIGEKEQVVNQEQALTNEDNISGLQLKAAEEMLAQNKTLEEVVQGYEKDLATLNSKLGPELFQSVLETATKDDAAKASDKENAFDDGLSETQTTQETGKEIGNADASIVEPDSKIEKAVRESNEQQVPIVSKASHEQGEEFSPGKDGDVDIKSKAGLSPGSSKDSIDFNGNEKQPSQIKEQLKAPILLAEQGATLQEIIEKYEKDLDTFNSRLGPNLAKAIVEARGKESLRKDDKDAQPIEKIDQDDKDEQPIEKVDQDLNQDKKEGIENVDSKEIVSSMDDGTHEEPVAQDKHQSNEKDDTKKAEEIEEQQEMDYLLDMFENDVTLEDEVKKLKKESKNLKEKLGPNLTKILLEEEQMGKGKEEEKRKEKEVGGSETKDMEIPCSVSGEQIGSPSSGKEKGEMLDAEENVAETAENQDGKCEKGKKDRITEDDVSPSGLKQKTFMAPKLMEAHNAPLEDVIQNYEHDLSVLKKALGPSLVNLLLNDKATPTAGNMANLTDASEVKEMPKLTQQDKEETRGMETETNRANEEDSISEEQRRTVQEEKQEKTEKESEQDEMKATEEDCLSETEPQESEELGKILSPLLNGDEDKSLEDILKTLHSDLDVLTSKLGSNLSKNLLTMDTDSYNVSNDKDKNIGNKDGDVGNQLDLETKGENEAKSEKVEDPEEGKDVKELEVEDKKKDDILGAETAGEEMEDLAVIDQMEENSQTLEEVIKQYEDNLEKYESSLGPYLSKAILSNEFIPEEAKQSQAKPNVDDKNAEEVPLDVHEDENEDKIKLLDGYLKLLDKGKTLEDLLMQYDPVHEVAPSTHGDENGLPITDETEPYSDQIKRLRNQNHDLRQELDNLNSKIGKGLVNQLQSKNDEGKTKDEGLGAKKIEQREGEKDTPEHNVAGIEGEKPSLEAPVMMAKDNRTLEDIVAEYENDIKEKNNAQEQLEQFIGPQLFKELSEFKRQEGQKEETKEEIDNESDEKEKEPSSKKLLAKSKYDVVNKMAEEEKSLAAVLGDNENDLEALERENASLKKVLEGVSGDGADLGEIISKYENQITMLENANKEAENNFEDKHNELQNEIDDLRSTLEKLAQTLRQDFLDDLMKQDSDNHIEALQIMEKENKTLAEVLEEYEENMKKLEREKAVLQQIAGQGEEGASMLDTVNDYEDTIKGLKEVNKVLNKRIDALTDKIGPQLTKQIVDLCDKDKPSETGGKDDKTKEETETMAVVKEMEDKKITLEEVLNMYDDQNKKEIASLDSSDQPKLSEKELDDKSEMDDNKKKADENEKEEEKATELIPEALYDKIGIQLIGDIKELDNTTYEELEKEDKRPYALRTMKARNEKLEDVIKAYENTLSNYGLLDTSALKEESLASELAAIEEDIAVDEGQQYGAKASDHVIESRNDEENADGQDDDDKQIEMLKKDLEEEKTLKEKYQKEAEDLLNDIVKLKMKNASGEDVDEEEVQKQIKEEYEQKQENKYMKEDLSKEKEKNKELQDEIRNMEKEIKNLEKAIEKMQESAVGISDGDVDGKIKELLVENENLEKELEALKNQLKENEENHKNEKNNLLQQSENEKRDTIKNLLDAKGEVEIKLQEQLALYHELEEKLKQPQEEFDKLRSNDSENEDKLAQLKMRNESLKEQLDLSEESMKDALQKYQDAIKALEIEKEKLEDDKKHEIELLNNKLELEKSALERLKNDYDEMLKKEKERQMEDFEKDLERERRRSQKDLEEQSEGFERKQNLHRQELQDAKEKAEKENAELRNSLEEEKEKLQKMFDEQMRRKDEEHEKILNQLRERLEDQLITEKAEMNVQFRQEKTELKTQIEKNIYGDELQKNIDLESDFQESLNKVLKDHTNEIEEIEKEMAQAEERFKDQKLNLLEEFENEKLKETKQHEKEKQEMESTIENLLKEIIKLKHQRKEMRQQYRVEKQNIEEISEKERIEIQENTERSKNELVTKLKQDHDKEMESEKEKYEVVIKELQEALDRAEAKKKELEEKLRNESLKAEESLNNKSVNESSSEEVTREVKVIKRGIEMEYEQKLTIEKQRFEDTLQGLRREVGNLQEKRKIIQERVYNQETHSSERHVIEKSIANYKLEMLSKLEGEMAQRIDRERKPLEEEVRELQIENEELKSQRWEMKAQFRREKAALEEEFEREKETLENNLNKEKEELRKRLEAKLQKEKHNKVFDVKVSRSTSPVLGEPSPRIDNTVRMLKQENLSLVSQNAKHEIDIEQLNEKLKFMEMNFKEMMETEKLKAEKMKRIQEQIPKTEMVNTTLPVPEYKPPSTGIKDDAILHNLQEKDQQIHQLLQTKKYYEEVFGELCDEAGLFELDRNQIV